MPSAKNSEPGRQPRARLTSWTTPAPSAVRTMARRVLNLFRGIEARRIDQQRKRHRMEVETVLASLSPPRLLDDEALFIELQSAYTPRPEYGYDSVSCWTRAVNRTVQLLKSPELSTPGSRVLETSCGDGMTGQLLTSFGHHVMLHDLEDWRDLRARQLPMVLGDLKAELPLLSGSFDLLCSYNAFEHVTNPVAALAELLRLCCAGGLVLLDFAPLYASAWGLHAYRTLRMPFPQFLFSEEFIQMKLQELGMWDLGKKQTALQPLNRWRLRDFDRIFRESGCEVVEYVRYPAEITLTEIILRHPAAFQGRGLEWNDVATEGVRVMLRKPRRTSSRE